MYDDLEQCLLLYVNEDVTHVLLEAYRVLDSIGLSDQDTELLNIMGMGSEETDGALLVGRIEACLTYAVGDQLSQYGIKVIDGTPLVVMTSILEATATFENYHIPEAVRDILLVDEFDDEEKFAEFISLFSNLEPVDVMFYLEEIRTATLDRINTTVNDEISTKEPPAEPIPQVRERARLINHLERTSPEKHLTTIRAVSDSGFQMGVNSDMILEQAVDILDNIDDNVQLAYEIMALAVYTDIDHVTVFKDFVDDYADSDSLKRQLTTTGMGFLTSNGYSDVKT